MIDRVLIVGLGSIGRRHLEVTRQLLPNAQIFVLRRVPDNNLPTAADGAFSTLKEAIDFRPQLSIIANPAPFHIDIALVLGGAGSHLLIEKPLSHTCEGIEELIALARNHNLRLQVGYNLRFLSSLARFREYVSSGAVGQVYTVRSEVGQYLPGWRLGKDYRTSVSARRELGGGVLLELSHEIDYLRWIFGDIEWVQASLTKQSNLEIDVEDCAQLILGFLPNSEGQQIVANAILDFVRRDTTRYCHVVGSEGSVRWDAVAGKLIEYRSESGSWREIFSHVPDQNETYKLQLKNMLEGISHGVPSQIDGVSGLAVIRIVDACRVSASCDGQRTYVQAIRGSGP